jgi:hypothetical protein
MLVNKSSKNLYETIEINSYINSDLKGEKFKKIR